MSAVSNIELMAQLEGGVFTETACSADVHSNYPLIRCLWAGKTAFQEVVIAESPTYGRVLFLDGELQSSSSDEAIYHEHLVHPLLSAYSEIPNKKILVVGGGEGATVREVLRWPTGSVASVDWVDIDGDLVDVCRQHLGWADVAVYDDPRLTFYPMDINTFLDRGAPVYDVIILDLPDPDVDELLLDTSDSDRLYGPKFNTRIMEHLAADGGLVSHCGPIRPGADERHCRPGFYWLQSTLFDGMRTAPYHVCIPSFQGEWGFLMNVRPIEGDPFPPGLRVMDTVVRQLALTWPTYWQTL
jgi:spermidine synthase